MAAGNRKVKRAQDAALDYRLKEYDWEGHAIVLRIPKGRGGIALLKRVAEFEQQPADAALDMIGDILDDLVESVDGEDGWEGVDGDLVMAFARVIFGFFGGPESAKESST